MRGDHIKATMHHDAGAYSKCSYCGRYSDIRRTLFSADPPACHCGRKSGWCGSFKPPTELSEWFPDNASEQRQGTKSADSDGCREGSE